MDARRISSAEIQACTGATSKTVQDWLAGDGPLLPDAVRRAIQWQIGELPGTPPKRRLTPPEMRKLFEDWVKAVGDVNVLGFDLWAAMEAGFNNGIARKLDQRETFPESGEPPEGDERKRA